MALRRLPGGDAVAGPFTLSDAPADHRGVLSLGDAWSDLRGAYGEQVSWELGTHETGDTVDLTLQSTGGGVAIFSRGGGRHQAPSVLRFHPTD
ncbi:MAG: hypothetical protein QF464_16840 [Myxococcota bacterium]|nr:hypothetical protein [Myxococcota bacterium]